jgi:hypothetical protein
MRGLELSEITFLVSGLCQGKIRRRLVLVPLPCATLGVIGQVASRLPIKE